MNRFHLAASSLALIAGLTIFTACTKKPLITVPLGPVTATGTLIPAEASLVRRGSHILMIQGTKSYYVESKTENLDSFEGQSVTIQGIAERNTTKDAMPVLVVSSVLALKENSELHTWDIPALDLKITLPEAWNAGIVKSVASFLLPDETVPLLVVSLSEEKVLPAGTPFYVGSHRAVRIASAPGSEIEDIFVVNKTVILHLHFDATTQRTIERLEDAKILLSQFENALTTLQFLSDIPSSQAITGTGALAPCGGGAGVLCPSGYFCDVFDAEAKIGKCRKVGQ